MLSLRNRHIHKCDLENVYNTLKIHIGLISIKTDGLPSIEHYGKDFDEKYNLGLVKGHYFINGYTELTSYCLDNCEEIEDIKDCNNIYNKFTDKYKKGNDRCIKAFQVFKVLMDNVDKLITPMELSDEVLNAQFYHKVNDYKALGYNKKIADQKHTKKKSNINITYSLILKPLPLNINTYHIYFGFTMKIYSRSPKVLIHVRLIC